MSDDRRISAFCDHLKEVAETAAALFGGDGRARQLQACCKKYEQRLQEYRKRASSPSCQNPIVCVGGRADDIQWLLADFLSADCLSPAPRYALANIDGLQHPDLPVQRVSASLPWGLGDSALLTVGSANGALDVASIAVHVVQYHELQTAAVRESLGRYGAARVIPVILRVPPRRDGQNRSRVEGEVSSFLSEVSSRFPRIQVCPPVEVTDFDHKNCDVDEDQIRQNATTSIQERLERSLRTPVVENSMDLHWEILLNDFSQSMQTSLKSIGVDALGEQVRTFQDKRQMLLEKETVFELAGVGELHAAVRMRLRSAAVLETPMASFPFRTALGLLALTHGAWDKVMMSGAGSPTAVILAAYQTTRNVLWEQKWRRHATELAEDRVNQRLGSKLEESLRSLRASTGIVAANISSTAAEYAATPKLEGFGKLIEEAKRLIDDHVRHALSIRHVRALSWTAALIFWLMMAGPILSQYAAFLGALTRFYRMESNAISDFPLLDLPRLLSAAFLAVLPMFLLGMIWLSWLCRPQNVNRVTHEVDVQLRNRISDMLRSGAVRLRHSSPLLERLEVLVRAPDVDRFSNQDAYD